MIQILQNKFDSWVNSIENRDVRELVKMNAFITGGAFISLMDNKEPNDYDIYFTNHETALAVANYYVDRWNKYDHGSSTASVVVDEETKRIKIYIQSYGVAEEVENNPVFLEGGEVKEKKKKERDKKKYRPVFLSANAITLSDKIQLITRFYGTPEEVHKSFDFVHCTCYYLPSKRELVLPDEALQSYIFKELKYVGSLYPIASILRTRKFIKRGWKINAGQYLKMMFQLENFNLTDVSVLEDQLNGVDLLYMRGIVDAIEQDKVNDPDLNIDSNYLITVVEKIFDSDDSYDERLDEEEAEEGLSVDEE